ncbi:MAG: nucleotidyltransferase family protein [Patescibacteria group bacterium]
MTDLNKIQEQIKPILQEYNVGYCGVFGSFARGDERPNSDLDLLVEFTKPIGLFDLVGMEQELTEKLGRKVDVLTVGTDFNPIFKKHMEKDLKHIYGPARTR